jgi:3'-phosphoadenosine 5'-phosphosulfate sulfotransferase (PAPS reductase)/FAD synthetase
MQHLDKVLLPPEIQDRLRDGADLVISMSGGKDSDALALALRELHRLHGWIGRLHIVHADLGRNDWSQTTAYVEHRAETLQLPLTVVRREQGDLLARWWQRHMTRPGVPPWSDARNRFCTSELKVGPINRWLRAWKPSGTVICAIGLRAAESPGRARKPVWSAREAVSTRNRHVFNWNPLHAISNEEVWDMLGISQEHLQHVRRQVQWLRTSGYSVRDAITQAAWGWHPAYALGNERLSCSLCVLASRSDLLNGAEHQPDHYRDLVDLEIASGFSFRQGLWLADLRPDSLTAEQRQVLHRVRAGQPAQPAESKARYRSIQLCLFN